jgi:hypothetical protein
MAYRPSSANDFTGYRIRENSRMHSLRSLGRRPICPGAGYGPKNRLLWSDVPLDTVNVLLYVECRSVGVTGHDCFVNQTMFGDV